MKIVTMKMTALAVALLSILVLAFTGIITYANPSLVGAARSGNAENMKKCLNDDTKLSDLYTTIDQAILYENINCLKVILEHLKARNLTLDNPELLLNKAASLGNKEAIDILIEYGVKQELSDGGKYTPVDAAIESKKYSMAIYLMKKGFLPYKFNIFELEGKENEAKELLYELIPYINQISRSSSDVILINAVRLQDMELIDKILNKSNNVNVSLGIVPIIDRSQPNNIKVYHNMDMVKYLFDRGVDPKSKWVQISLKQSVSRNDLEMVKFLLDKGTPAISDNSEICIMEKAVNANNIEMLRLLMDHGIDVNGSKISGINNPYTPLGRAINNLNVDIVSFLLQKGARKENITSEGYDAFKLLDNTRKKIYWYDLNHKKAADEIEKLLKGFN